MRDIAVGVSGIAIWFLLGASFFTDNLVVSSLFWLSVIILRADSFGDAEGTILGFFLRKYAKGPHMQVVDVVLITICSLYLIKDVLLMWEAVRGWIW